MYAAIVEGQRRHPRRVDTMRFCLVAGDVCPPQLQQDFHKIYGVPLRSFWGSTETFGTFTFGLQPGPVSRPAPGTQFRLIDNDGHAVARGEVGELVVRGPSVTIGYWSGPDQIATPSDCWFPTGDLMREGEGRELWFVSRKKDLIIRGGSNISPIEVQGALMAHPAVRDAAVIGIPDVNLGQRVVGLVTLTGTAGKRFYSAFRAPRLSRALAIINPRRSASSSHAASLSRRAIATAAGRRARPTRSVAT